MRASGQYRCRAAGLARRPAAAGACPRRSIAGCARRRAAAARAHRLGASWRRCSSSSWSSSSCRSFGVFWWSTQEGGLTTGTKFVGLDNFVGCRASVDAADAIRNTLLFALLSIPATLIIALGVAMLLARIERGGSIYRFLVYFPVLVPGVVAGLIWLFLTNVDFGLFNTSCASLGVKPVIWLGAESRLAGAGRARCLAQRRLLGDVLPGRHHRPAEGALSGSRARWRDRLAALPSLTLAAAAPDHLLRRRRGDDLRPAGLRHRPCPHQRRPRARRRRRSSTASGSISSAPPTRSALPRRSRWSCSSPS